MLIDWFTVGAQALNFLILVWLMKRFLYKPILHAIDAREERIAKELADADAKKTEAQKERDEFAQKNHQFDQQRAALLSKATDEAQAEGYAERDPKLDINGSDSCHKLSVLALLGFGAAVKPEEIYTEGITEI